ncbi:MAG: hypothetical protein H0V60_04400, partial [Actinobacteria bacterium]|nr:hypothetical protein [Actinomycetota bacterium]
MAETTHLVGKQLQRAPIVGTRELGNQVGLIENDPSATRWSCPEKRPEGGVGPAGKGGNVLGRLLHEIDGDRQGIMASADDHSAQYAAGQSGEKWLRTVTILESRHG